MLNHYIDGEFVTAGTDQFQDINPSTEEVIDVAPRGTQEDVRRAVASARKAQKSWRRTSRVARSEYFERLCEAVKKHKDDLVRDISRETGKSLNESLAEVNEALHMAQYTFGMGRQPIGQMLPSEIADKDCYVVRKPKGVVAIIGPWNFPAAINGFWNAAPAILEGNTVVLKPSEDAPLMGHWTARLYDEAGFPPGVFNLVQGEGSTGAHLVDDDIDHICFTGSADVGRVIRIKCANKRHTSCSCEMGSKSAVIVFADADQDMALEACLASAFKLSGQRCVSAGRILIERSVYDNFCDKFTLRAAMLLPGDPLEGNFPFGPLINADQVRRVQRYNEMTNDGHANVLVRGGTYKSPGFFLTPHVYQAEWADKKYLKEEVFGPHVALVPFDTLDDAVHIYNDTNFGLSCAVCTSDYRKMRYIRDNCDFGLGYVNLPCIGAESQLIFSGVKGSGYGGASAAGTFDTVVHKVTWTVNHQDGGFQMAQGLK